VLTVGIACGEDRSCFRATDESGNPVYAGWECEVLNVLADNLPENVTMEYIYAADQKELTTMLAEGRVDIAAGSYTRLDTYASQYLLSDNYGYGSVYLVNAKNSYIDNLAAYKDENIGVSNSIPATSVSEVPGIEGAVQSAYIDMSLMAIDIRAGVVDAGLCTEREAVQLLNDAELNIQELRNGPQVGMVFLLPGGQTDLLNRVNSAISTHYDELADAGSRPYSSQN
jgi:ABC-type amino acid transport substrate-binding protein